MGKKKGCDCPAGLPGWMATFADMMTLLLTFFVLLLSMSSMDQQKIKEALGSLRGSLGVLRGGTKSEVNLRELLPSLEIVEVTPRTVLARTTYEKIRVQLHGQEMGDTVQADLTEEGVLLHVDSKVLFRTGEGEVGPGAKQVLQKVAEILQENEGHVRIEGHTDNVPIKTIRYPSNWDLSTSRAVSVLRLFVEEMKMDAKSFSAVGYGDTRPIASNLTGEGRARNRRVTIVLLHPKPKTEASRPPKRLEDKERIKSGARRKTFHFSTNLRKELHLKMGEE